MGGALRSGRALAAPLLLWLLLGAAGAAGAASVFVDADADGVRGAGERGAGGVLVSDGVRLVETAADGSYALEPGPDGFVFLIRPAGFRCEKWWRRDAGDFALVPDLSRTRDFFFVQLSDAHVYDRGSDFPDYSLPRRWWLPDSIENWLLLKFAAHALEPRYTADLAGGLRAALARTRSVDELGDFGLLGAYLDEFARPGSELGDVAGSVRAALQEVAALEPAFAVNTGDLVLEANMAPPEPVERWMRFYREETRALGIPFYETIGNNEIAGSDNEDFDDSDPRYGKALFHATFGPSYYSFERGPFHFVAIDTHWRIGDPDDSDGWVIARMSERMKTWLEADLARARAAGRVVVALNHEPFIYDPSWPFPEDPDQKADDQGLFRRYGVAYVLAGHTHFNGFAQVEGTTHIVTGALSGFRWLLPPDVYPRGYRLFYAKDGKLYSAWKRLGSPALGFVAPIGDPDLFPGSAGAPAPDSLAGEIDVVAVAADARGPFPRVELELGGRPLASERWGDYFLHARLDAGDLGAGGETLSLVATRATGEALRADLRVRSGSSAAATGSGR